MSDIERRVKWRTGFHMQLDVPNDIPPYAFYRRAFIRPGVPPERHPSILVRTKKSQIFHHPRAGRLHDSFLGGGEQMKSHDDPW